MCQVRKWFGDNDFWLCVPFSLFYVYIWLKIFTDCSDEIDRVQTADQERGVWQLTGHSTTYLLFQLLGNTWFENRLLAHTPSSCAESGSLLKEGAGKESKFM